MHTHGMGTFILVLVGLIWLVQLFLVPVIFAAITQGAFRAAIKLGLLFAALWLIGWLIWPDLP